MWGFPDEAREAVYKVVQSLRSETANIEAEVIQTALTLSAGIGVQAYDEKLADIVSDVSIELCGPRN
jgi:hypothetical protein